METWFIIILTLCISALLKSFFSLFFPSSINNNNKKLPPGPTLIPVIGRFLWLRKPFFELECILKDLKLKYGPILTIRLGSRTAIFVSSHSIAHRALVQNGAVFSDRPKGLPTNRVISSNQHNISSAGYGSTWRLLRRNLTSEILHPSRVKSYSHARNWVLGILIRRLFSESVSGSGESTAIKVMDHFQYAMFCLLALMCFGDKLEENQIKQIEKVQRDLLLNITRFNILNLWPKLGKVVFRQRWKEFLQLCQNREDVLVPLIKARVEKSSQRQEQEFVVAYVDTLLNLQLPDEENRKLTYGDLVSLCGEFLNAGTDTTSTALEWIMANLVKYPHIQTKLYEEIVGVVGPRKQSSALSGGGPGKMVEEEDLQRMPYLKAVVLESLRRHPPGHFVLPHSVTEDVELDGYVVPKNAVINFMVAEMGRDPKVWNDPMEFKPERFLNINGEMGRDPKVWNDPMEFKPERFLNINGESRMDGGEGFDITGSREIKMMPFGAGRRICPGFGLALLHLEYFVANLIWYFEWKVGADVDVDLSEKQVFTVVMKNSLLAHISPRAQS